jgi:hypothetical protein
LNKSLINIGSSVLISFCILLIFLALKAVFIDPSHNEGQRRIQMGNEIVLKIRKFYKTNHRLPTDLVEIGVAGDDLSIFGYKKVYTNDFEIYYEPNFGDINTFSSQSNAWSER